MKYDSHYDFERSINNRSMQLANKIIEAVRTLGNTTKENIEQLKDFRDAFKDSQHITVVDHAPILDIYSFSEYSDVFSEANAPLLLIAIAPVLPQFNTIQYNEFEGKHSELNLLIATQEEKDALVEVRERERLEEADQQEAERQRDIAKRLQKSRIPPFLQNDYTFESFKVMDIDKNHSNKEAYRLARQFTTIDCIGKTQEEVDKELEGWHNFLTYYGAPGTGKTRMALTIGLYQIHHDDAEVRYWQVQDLFETLKGTFNKAQHSHKSYDGNDDVVDDSYSKILEQIKNCDTLILDDLGAENGTPWVMSILDMLIDYRYENQNSTIITSNVNSIDDLPARIASRLSEGNTCKINMPDFRKVKAAQREKKTRKVS